MIQTLLLIIFFFKQTDILLDNINPVVDSRPVKQTDIFFVHLIDIKACLNKLFDPWKDAILGGSHDVKVLEVLLAWHWFACWLLVGWGDLIFLFSNSTG